MSGSRDVPDGPGADRGNRQGRPVRPDGVALTVLGFVVEASGVWPARCPWDGRRGATCTSFTFTFSSVAVGIYVVLLLLKNIRWLGLPLVATVLLDLGLAVTVLYAASAQLVPALHSYWLWIHVSTAIFCGAVFYVGGVASALFIFRDRYEAKLASGGKPGAFATSVMERLPSAATLDKFAYRVNATVLPLWTFTIIAGAIWAGQAWGKYWGWDPKETWAFITWVAYACYLHARSTAGWKGRKAAYLALIAFACSSSTITA